MPYKIVETVERGKKVLSIIPENWEQNGILMWPTKNYEKLKLDPNSTPSDSWLPMQCKTKRRSLQSYDSAEIELNVMSDATDTELEEDGMPPKRLSNFDFNHLVKNTLSDQVICNSEMELPTANVRKPQMDNNIEKSPTTLTAPQTAGAIHAEVFPMAAYNVEEEPPSSLFVQETPTSEVNLQNVYLVTDTDPGTAIQDQVNIKILSQKIDKLTKIARDLQNNQQNIMLKLASVITSVEEYMKKVTYESNATRSTTFKTISDLKMLQEFENNLKNEDLKREYMKQLSIICSKGKGRGTNNAYVLVDVMFSRQLMTQCSWAGGTRKASPKSCFKAYVLTIDFFFDIVHDSDKDFSKNDCYDFFKKMLRYSESRYSCKKLRCSTEKKRPKKTEGKLDQLNITPQSSTTKPCESKDSASVTSEITESQPSTSKSP